METVKDKQNKADTQIWKQEQLDSPVCLNSGEQVTYNHRQNSFSVVLYDVFNGFSLKTLFSTALMELISFLN